MNDVPDIIKAAVGKGNIFSFLQHHDFHAFISAAKSCRCGSLSRLRRRIITVLLIKIHSFEIRSLKQSYSGVHFFRNQVTYV